jgi:hypothetical protein
MAYTSGKKAYFISDRSGLRYPYKERIKEWNGSIVHISEYEAKHPQLEFDRQVVDVEALRDPRPDRSEPAVEVLLPLNPLTTGSAGGGTTVITVSEPNHGRTNSSTIRFRNVVGFDGITTTVLESASGYTITVVDTNRYTVTVSATATLGSQTGGGGRVTVGPTTLEN